MRSIKLLGVLNVSPERRWACVGIHHILICREFNIDEGQWDYWDSDDEPNDVVLTPDEWQEIIEQWEAESL